ncbi:hypothetical protein LAZ40_11040 [Cereibacter sphaeroides]|uniref:hypothetical protein n=1 Tax=Cereibacter sphaeroides TaxID=1063 RepID=UPI001F3CF26F|nr:hypothetical protein [Cereibacter sphaeroides]MCE6959591.1 hypothetical protein [Cereibacter sphaeroides]MCE6974549.1 hypothetical protein [Cereibacter sphaeroides]
MPSAERDYADIETFIQAAKDHGSDSEPDHEVGDLQDMLRAAWEIMTPEQRVTLVRSDACRATAEAAWFVDFDDEVDPGPG